MGFFNQTFHLKVETEQFKEQVRRSVERFPEVMLELTLEEY